MTSQAEKDFLIGQLRVTSLTVLLVYFCRVAVDRGLNVAMTIRPLIFSDNYGEPQFNLAEPDRLPVLRALCDGLYCNPDAKDESVRNIFARYQDIFALDLAEELKLRPRLYGPVWLP
jgi:hypothetical protein